MVEHYDSMVARLKVKAYQQGFDRGDAGLKPCRADWEEEFWPDYFRGHADGVKAREQKEKNHGTD